MTPSEINKELDKLYNDDAKKILEKWEAFNEILINYDNAGENIKKAVEGNTADKSISINENSTDSEIQEAATKASDTQTKAVSGGLAAEEIAAHDYLETVEYGDGTMLEFFERDKSEFEDSENIRELYPIVDSLTGGQLAGLDFLSIKDMVVMALTDENGFKKVDLNDVLTASIYQDVNREIYEKGGVALTDAAMRAKATAQEATPTLKLSTLGSVLWTCTAVSGAAAAASAIAHAKLKNSPYLKALTEYQDKMKSYQTIMNKDGKGFGNLTSDQKTAYKNLLSKKNAYENSEVYQKALFKSNITKYLAAGFTVLGAVLAGVSIYTTIEEMKAFYKVEFTPIPKYIVDRADITAVNQKGETVMVKNQTAYYKAVLCNRTAGSSAFEKKNYEILKDRNDLNGDVGMQWLSLYSVKYENGTPILADSLKVKLGKGDAPEGYTNGIHRFGEKDTFNLTSRLYCYNDPNDGTYVYFKNDTATVKDLTATGSLFSGGSIALGALVGLIVGSAVTLFIVNNKKKKEEKA